MKRNKEIARRMRAGTSPYARYRKRPYRYSADLVAWERSVGRKVAAEYERETREVLR